MYQCICNALYTYYAYVIYTGIMYITIVLIHIMFQKYIKNILFNKNKKIIFVMYICNMYIQSIYAINVAHFSYVFGWPKGLCFSANILQNKWILGLTKYNKV